jgi:hypothetical protein
MKLHDIFPEVPIVEYSLYAFMGVTLLGLGFLYFFYRLFIHKQKRIHSLQILEQYNPKDAKYTAYQISYYGKKLAKNEIQKKYLTSLELKLNHYKYLQTSSTLSQSLQKEIEIFIQLLKGKHV